MAGDVRIEQIRDWLARQQRFEVARLEPASNDASFRRYFRIWRRDGASRVVMDAPPDKEDVQPFLKIAALLEGCGVHVPRVEAADVTRGFLLLEDLGSTHYLAQLRRGASADELYEDAFEALLLMQTRGAAAAQELSPYDRAALMRELMLMPEWFCARHLGLTLNAEDQALLDSAFGWLCNEALSQPRVFVHRDFHSRNLMLLAKRNPGVIDFQDALAGPIGYDLVSLLKDCYIDWPRARVEAWVAQYRQRLAAAGGAAGADERQFLRWFDLIGVQRHIKVLGIFARLWLRDGKSGYLADLPRTLSYVLEALRLYPELRELSQWFDRRVLPYFDAANARALAAAAQAERAAAAP